jgi:phenylacetate-CoA ligase
VGLWECHKLLAEYLADQVALTEGRREAVRERAVRRVVQHAYRRVPYYRRLFDSHGIDPASIRGPEDLARIPPTSKQDIMTLPPEELVAEGVDPGGLFRIRTSGSTGQPLTILRTWPEQRLTALRALYTCYREGLRLADRRVAFSVARRRRRERRPFLKGLLRRAAILRNYHIDCRLPREEMIQRLRRLRPDHIGGYAGAIADVAAAMTEADRAVVTPRTIAANSEVLTPGMRRAIRDAFGVEPFDRYGCHELGIIGWECREAHGMHLCRDAGVFEVVADGRPAVQGETGTLLGTSLYCFAMPFIRYDPGDAVTFGGTRCRCGARVSVLSQVDGRTIQSFTLPGGVSLHAYEIVRPLLEAAPWMMQYQVVQTGASEFRVRAVRRPRADTPDPGAVRAVLQSAIGGRATIEVVIVDRIERDPATGKFRVFVPFGAAPSTAQPA